MKLHHCCQEFHTWRSNKVGFLSLTYYGVSVIAKALLTYTLYMLNAHKIWHILTSWNLAQQARRSMLAISGSVNISYLGFAKIYNSIKNWVINSCFLSQDNWIFVRLWLQLFNSSGKILDQLFWFKQSKHRKYWVINSCWLSQDNWTFVIKILRILNNSSATFSIEW